MQQKQISKLSSVVGVRNFFGFDKGTTSNEYIGIDSKEHFSEKTLWLRKQPYLYWNLNSQIKYIHRPSTHETHSPRGRLRDIFFQKQKQKQKLQPHDFSYNSTESVSIPLMIIYSEAIWKNSVSWQRNWWFDSKSILLKEQFAIKKTLASFTSRWRFSNFCLYFHGKNPSSKRLFSKKYIAS